MPAIEFQPYSQAFAANPYPTYAQLREQTPIFYDAEWGMTFFTTYTDINKLLVNRKLGRTMDHISTATEIAQRRKQENRDRLPNYNRFVRQNFLETEGEDHARLRKLLYKVFTPRRVSEQREPIQRFVDESLARLEAAGEMDFLEDFVTPLPVYVIASLLGMPLEDRHLLRPWSAAIVRLYEQDYSADDEQRAETASTEFADYLTTLATERRARPQEDLISALALVQEEGEMLSHDELVSTCILLLNAGHESTVNTAGNGMLALQRHPDQLSKLKQNPALINTAVEEMLRYDSPLHLFHRFVLEDLEYEGFTFKRGDKLGFLYGAANRDPAVFENPDRFDIERQPNRHLAFGKGTHFCMGAPLARLELQILFNSLLKRLPDIKLGVEQPEYETGLVFRGLKALPLKW